MISEKDLPPEIQQKVIRSKNFRISGAGEAFEMLPEQTALFKNEYHKHLKPLISEEKNIDIVLSDISQTELARYPLQGFLPNDPIRQKGWTGITRFFTRPDGVLISLNEWDFKKDHGSISLVKEKMNSYINGFPGRLGSFMTPSGQVTLTEQSWATKEKYFELTVWADLDPGDGPFNKEWFLRIARQIQ